MHLNLLGFMLSISSALVVTEIFKIGIGRLRPDWVNRCGLNYADIQKEFPGYTLLYPLDVLKKFHVVIDKKISDGQKSFISGHASSSIFILYILDAFSSMFYLFMYLLGRTRVYFKGQIHNYLICMAPLLLAIYIGITRYQDNRHHWQDIICGAVTGIITSIFSYCLFFYNVFGDKAGQISDSRYIRSQNIENSII